MECQILDRADILQLGLATTSAAVQRIGYLGRSIGLEGPGGAPGGPKFNIGFWPVCNIRNSYSNGFNIRRANKKNREFPSYLENLLTWPKKICPPCFKISTQPLLLGPQLNKKAIHNEATKMKGKHCKKLLKLNVGECPPYLENFWTWPKKFAHPVSKFQRSCCCVAFDWTTRP